MAQEILTSFQMNFIYLLAKDKALKKCFYLTGGTALAAYYLHHRYSADLDFFSKSQVDILGVNSFLKTNKSNLQIKKVDYQQSFNRNIFFLHSKKEILKIEFTYFPFDQIEKPLRKDGILVDSIVDIAANKLFTIFQNPRARDFIDLYYILRKYSYISIPKLIILARSKFDSQIDPLQLGTQMLKSKEMQDLPRMLKEIDHQRWRSLFLNQAKSLSKDIFE